MSRKEKKKLATNNLEAAADNEQTSEEVNQVINIFDFICKACKKELLS